jgi:hypothetical protein
VFDGRTLDDNVIKASYVLDDEWARATAGEWVSKQRWVGVWVCERAQQLVV